MFLGACAMQTMERVSSSPICMVPRGIWFACPQSLDYVAMEEQQPSLQSNAVRRAASNDDSSAGAAAAEAEATTPHASRTLQRGTCDVYRFGTQRAFRAATEGRMAVEVGAPAPGTFSRGLPEHWDLSNVGLQLYTMIDMDLSGAAACCCCLIVSLVCPPPPPQIVMPFLLRCV